MQSLTVFFIAIKATVSFSTLDEYISYRPLYLEAKDDTSEGCRLQLDEYWRGLANGELWAWNMFDSSSKLPSGLLTGNTMDYGNFDQCLAVNHDGELSVKGKYCFAGASYILPIPFAISGNSTSNITWPKISLSIHTKETFKGNKFLPEFRADTNDSSNFNFVRYTRAVCIPDQCRPTEIDFPLAILKTDNFCQTTEREIVAGDYIGIAFFALVILLMIVSTSYSVYLTKNKRKPAHPLLLSFCAITNGQKLFTVSYNPRNLTCLGGLRFISILWVVMGHSYGTAILTYFLNGNYIQTWLESLYTQYVQSAMYAVDTFFVLGGCLVSYGALIPLQKLKSRMENMKPKDKALAVTSTSLSFWLTRYLRITPSLLAVFVVHVTFQRHLSSGPLWNQYMDQLRETCLENWWSFFLYIENYVHTDNMCILHAWYLQADMQLYFFSPILLWLLVYLPKITSNGIMPIVTVAATIITWVIFYVDDIAAGYLYLTHARMAAWLIGLLFGVFMCKYKDKEIRISRLINWMIWVIVLAGFVALIIGQHYMTLNHERFETYVWAALHRPAWAIGICWVVFACVKGYGGIINTFLSLPAFQILGRLTFCIYLVHFFVLYLEVLPRRVIGYFSDFNLFYKFLSDLVLSTLLAIFWVLAFESPMITVERFLMGRTAIRKEKESLIKNEEHLDRGKENIPEEVLASKM